MAMETIYHCDNPECESFQVVPITRDELRDHATLRKALTGWIGVDLEKYTQSDLFSFEYSGFLCQQSCISPWIDSLSVFKSK